MSNHQTRTISVVVPCHNYGRFLGEAVASIDGQDLRPDEILICDDGSTDDSVAHAREIVSGRTDATLMEHREARGLVQTLNELARNASGAVIVPLSADDRMGPRYISSIARAIFDDGYDFAYTDMRCFGAEDWTFVAPTMDVDRLARFNFIHGSSGVRRSVFDAVGGYSADFERVGFEDYDFWISVVEAGFRGTKASGTHLEWRRHAEGSRNTATASDRLRLRWKLLRHHPRFFLHPRTLRAWTPSNRPIPGLETPP